MYGNGILMLFKGYSKNYIAALYKKARMVVNERLYITLDGLSSNPGNLSAWSNAISTCYAAADENCPELDVRLLLPTQSQMLRDRGCRVILVDDPSIEEAEVRRVMLNISSMFPKNLVYTEVNFAGPDEPWTEATTSRISSTLLASQVPHACMGGTFDRLHNGHRVLLGVASLACRERLTVGVTDPTMLKGKTLSELIEPIDIRMRVVREFLDETRPGLEYHVCRLEDPFGPPIYDPVYERIVASEETRKGCEKINEIRLSKGFNPLEIHIIPFVEDSHRQTDFEEEKVSSSSRRHRLLGTLLRPPRQTSLNPGTQPSPYVIGLTGGIASGKSSACRKLKEFGAGIVDCDKLGHQAYKSGSACFSDVVALFGPTVVGADGEIDRRQLGTLVFADGAKLDQLSALLWPEILRLALNEVERLGKEEEARVVVLDAAVLLEAGWDTNCNEVWTTMVPPKEAVRRLMERNNLSEADAQARLDRQPDNQSRVARANIVICPLWKYEYTAQQLERAWRSLSDRLDAAANKETKSSPSSCL